MQRTSRPVGSLRVEGIGLLLTMAPGAPDGIPDAAVVIRDGAIAWAGPAADLDTASCADLPVLDAGGGLVTPGLVECHSHLVFLGQRSDEFAARAAGRSYEDIARRGGGIARTVAATRAGSRDALFAAALPRVRTALAQGITTLEAKSGYGLDLDTELRLLAVAADLDAATPVDVVPTFLGAHALPPEARDRRDAHVDAIVREWIPAVARQGIARFCDVFCESVAFTVDESRRILQAGLDHGLRPKVHAEQLGRTGGAALAAELGAVSADHLDHASPDDLAALAAAGTVGVLLPGGAVSLGRPRFPPAAPLREAGVRVALSTDFNPGSSVTQNLPLMATFAMAFMGMTAAQAWAAITTNAAAALGLDDRVGRVAPGYRGDLAVFHGADPLGPFYEWGGSRIARVVKDGRVVVAREPDGRTAFPD
jgi:imidazolonepropionase